MNVIYKKFANDSWLSGIATIATSFKGLIILPILAKELSPSLFGIWSQIMAAILLLLPFCFLELQYSMTRFLSAENDRRKINEGVSSILLVVGTTTLIVSIIIYITSWQLAIIFFKSVNAAPFVKLSAIMLIATMLDQFFLQYFISFRQMERYSAFTVLQAIVEPFLIWYLVILGYGLLGAFYSTFCARILILLGMVLLTKSEIKLTYPNFTLLKSYLIFSLPLIPLIFSFWIINNGNKYIIGFLMDTEAVGIYSATYILGSIIGSFYGPIALLIFPTITVLYNKNKIIEIKNILKYVFRFFIMLSIPSLIGIAILSKPLLELLATSEYLSNWAIIPIIALSIIFSQCGNLFSEILMLFKYTKQVSQIYGFVSIIYIVLNIIFISLMGLIGAALATMLTFMIQSAILYSFSSKLMPFELSPKFIIKCLLSSAIMGYCIFLFSEKTASLAILIIFGMITYFGSMILLKGFSREEYSLLKRLINPLIKKASISGEKL